MMNKLLFFIITFVFISCADQNPQNRQVPESLSEKIDFFIEQDEYEKALTTLEEQAPSEQTDKLREKTHLNYGIHLIYQSVPENMRENANNALRQFIEVLKINPNNEKAISEIDQIMSIYATFPDRSPREDILEDLRRLGFDY